MSNSISAFPRTHWRAPQNACPIKKQVLKVVGTCLGSIFEKRAPQRECVAAVGDSPIDKVVKK